MKVNSRSRLDTFIEVFVTQNISVVFVFRSAVEVRYDMRARDLFWL